MKRALSAIAASCMVVLGGCENAGVTPQPNEQVTSEGLSVTRVPGGIRLANQTTQPVAYLVWNRGWLGLLAPCIDPSPACLRLAAGASGTVLDRDIEGYAAGMTEAVVRFWRVESDGHGGYRVHDDHEVIVRL